MERNLNRRDKTNKGSSELSIDEERELLDVLGMKVKKAKRPKNSRLKDGNSQREISTLVQGSNLSYIKSNEISLNNIKNSQNEAGSSAFNEYPTISDYESSVSTASEVHGEDESSEQTISTPTSSRPTSTKEKTSGRVLLTTLSTETTRRKSSQPSIVKIGSNIPTIPSTGTEIQPIRRSIQDEEDTGLTFISKVKSMFRRRTEGDVPPTDPLEQDPRGVKSFEDIKKRVKTVKVVDIMRPRSISLDSADEGDISDELAEMKDGVESAKEAKKAIFSIPSISAERKSIIDAGVIQYGQHISTWPRGTPRYMTKLSDLETFADIHPVDIGHYLQRGFRTDLLSLSGEMCFLANPKKITEKKKHIDPSEMMISFTERDSVLDFLIQLGFSSDDAKILSKDMDFSGRFRAALSEAYIWTSYISKDQAGLLFFLAYKSRPKIMRYFLQLVEAIINNRITTAVRIDGFLRILEKVEDGYLSLVNIFGSKRIHEDEDEEMIRKQKMEQLFANLCEMTLRKASAVGRTSLTDDQLNLLHFLVSRYKPVIFQHLNLLTTYIGECNLVTEIQLEAALLYLSGVVSEDVNLNDFEVYCDIKKVFPDNDSHSSTSSSSISGGK